MSEDDAEYEWFNPSVRRLRKLHRNEPTPLQAIKTTATEAESSEHPPVSQHDQGKITLVGSVMIKTPYYCRENQSEEEALKMLRELNLPYLPVLDSNLRVVGVVSMKDLMRSKEQKDPPQS